ncbi:RNA polymerase II-binding domain [Trinorchestia longiramus]|nr:RNA polymerase II-binding domain [Trinorchestia longiramus]
MATPAAGDASGSPADMSTEVAAEYKDALKELNSSKPQITFLTMLADEYKEHTAAIVTTVVEYAHECTQVQKLPCLYLVDSIIKNVKGEYVKLFQQKIHHLFAHIFEKVDEKTRRKMYELRQTWNDIFRKSTLYGLDVKVQALDPAWPVTAPTPSSSAANQSALQPPRTKPSTIFVNPSLLKSRGLAAPGSEVGAISKELDLRELHKHKLTVEKKQSIEKPKYSEKQSSMSSSNSNNSHIASKPPSRPSDIMELATVTAPETTRAIERKTSTSSNSTSNNSSGSNSNTTNNSSSSTSHTFSSSSGSGRSTDRSSVREQWLKSYKIKKKQTELNSRDMGKPSSTVLKSQSPLTTPPDIRRLSVTAPHAPKAANVPFSVSTSSTPTSTAPSISAPLSRDPRAPVTPTSVAAPSTGAFSNRDPRTWPVRPTEVAPGLPVTHHKSHASAKGPTSSRDPRMASKNRSSSSRSRSRDVTDEASQLFKPDVLTKVPTKIKIDLKSIEKPKYSEKQSSMSSSNSNNSHIASKPPPRPSDIMELATVTAPETTRAIERKTSTSSNSTSNNSSGSNSNTTNNSNSSTSHTFSSSSGSGRSTDRSSVREQWLKSYKIKKKQTELNSRDMGKPSSTVLKSQSPLTTPPDIRRLSVTAPHAPKAANVPFSVSTSSTPTSTAPSIFAPLSRDPRAPVTPTSVAAPSTGAFSNRDPRTWPVRPTEVAPGLPVTHHKSHASAKGPTSSRDPRMASKNRSSSSRSRSRDVTDEASQLFKPDVLTKVPTKIKIDLKVFDATSVKPQPASNPPSDLRIKSRDPRLAAKEEKAKEISSTLFPSSAVEPSAQAPTAVASKKEASSTGTTKDVGKVREKSTERREEIQRELKKMDRKESRRTEHRSLSPVPKKSEKADTSKHRESSSHRSRDRRPDSKSRVYDQKKGSSLPEDLPNKPSQSSSASDNKNISPDSLQSPSNTVKSTSVSTAVSLVSTEASSSSVGRMEQQSVSVALTTTTTETIAVSLESAKQTVIPTSEAGETKVPPDDLSSTAQDAFRNVDRSASRRRHLRKRTTPSPEPMDVSSSPCLAPSAEDETQQAREDGTESDESDHYEANKPKPPVYSDKKGGASASGDVDLRLLGAGASGKVLPAPDSTPVVTAAGAAVAAAATGPVDDLFGSTDVDLRKMAEPLQALPAAFQEGTGGGATVPREDQDLRQPAPSLPKQETPSVGAKEEDLDDPEILIVDQKTHPSNWVKFREKNPEFKEYQRKCSTPSFCDFNAAPLPYSQARARQVKKSLQDEEDTEGRLPGADRLRVIITQAEEELRQGEISMAAYNNTLQQVLAVYEREKMMQAQARDRSCSPAALRDLHDIPPRDRPLDGALLPPPPLPPRLRSPLDKRAPLPLPPRPEFDRGGFRRDLGPVRGTFGSEFSGPHDEWTGEPDLPTVPENILRQIARDSETRTIDIDGRPREIRTYGNTAILLMDSFDPRTVAFEDGHCNIVFDGGEFVIPMRTDEDYKEFHIDGETHRVKLGVPTQELFLDDRGYQCFFGGKPITIHLAGRVRTIRLDGRPPTVTIGKEANRDFLLGKISLVVNANTKRMMSLYLDAKPQRISIDGKVLVLKFVDKFRGVDINSVIHPVSFGGLPTRVSVRQLRKYLSFSSLPPDLIPGEVSVIGMDCDTIIPNYALLSRSLPPLSGTSISSTFKKGVLQPPPLPPSSLSSFPARPPAPQPSFTVASDVLLTKPRIGMPGPPPFPKLPAAAESKPAVDESVLILNDSELPVSESKLQKSETSSSAVVPGSYTTNEGPSKSPPPPRSSTPRNVTPSPAPANPASLDVSSLIQTLIKVGIIGKPTTTSSTEDAATAPRPSSSSASSAKDTTKDNSKTPTIQVKKLEQLKSKPQPTIVDQNDEDWMEPEEGAEPKASSISKMDFLFKSQQLRRRSSPLVAYLHRGMQCSSCGMRYPAEQTMHYSQHLDWHFRQNKREQESTKKANSRKLYIPIDDWMQYEEIEDVDERVPSMFEAENGAAGGGLLRDTSRDEDEETEASVPVNSDEPGLGVCPVCRDTFSQFFQHNTDEWHYRNAIARDGVNYHPSCYQDLVKQKEKEEKAKQLAAEEAEREVREKNDEKARLASGCPNTDVSASTDEAQSAADTSANAGAPAADVEMADASAPDTIAAPASVSDTPDAVTSVQQQSTEPVSASTALAAGAAVANEGSTAPAADTVVAAAADATVPADSTVPAAETATAISANAEVTNASVAAESQGADSGTAAADRTTAGTDSPAPADLVGAADSPAPEAVVGANPAAQPKKKKKKKKKKPVQPIVPAVRIKEEPLDEGDIIVNPGNLQVKQEKPDEPEIEEQALDEGIEEMEQSAAEDEMNMLIDTTGDLSASRSTLLTSTIDGNVEENEAPDTTPASAPMPRIRLSGALGGLLAKSTNKDADTDKSFPISVIGDDSNPPHSEDAPPSPTSASKNDGENETRTSSKENGLVAEDEGVEGVQSDDDDIIEWDEFIPPPFTPDLKRHPRFQGASMTDVGVTRAGLEESGLCSIM